MIFHLRDDVKKGLGKNISFDDIFKLQGKIYREVKNRRTFSTKINDEIFFVKCHIGIGWKEIGKNLTSGKIPILGAKNEWNAIKECENLSIPTMKVAGYGKNGLNPATQKSFIITDALKNMETLEDFCPKHFKEPNPDKQKLKEQLIIEIATIARKLHKRKITHHDLYICHFLIDISQNNFCNGLQQNITLYLIDLHRAQRHYFLLKRYIIKDLAAIYFSSMDLYLAKADIQLFIETYSQKPFALMTKKQKKFWALVKKRAIKLYWKIHGCAPSVITRN